MTRFWAVLLLLLGPSAQAEQNPAVPSVDKTGPVKVPVVRDTWFSNYRDEANGNCGGSDRLKVKSIQEMSLVDINPVPLRGRVVRAATLHVRSASAARLRRVTVSSFGAEWVEGTGIEYEVQKGSSTHNRRQHPDVLWAGPGSDLCSVMLGQGGTLWRMADATPPDAEGWQKIAVDPAVVAARIAGISYGFLLYDDTGSEWSRRGEQFKIHLFPNRFFYSREAGPENAPYLTVLLGPEDKSGPLAPTELAGQTGTLPSGEATLSWVTPRDNGPAGTIGFFVTVNGKEVPRYLVPLAGQPGTRVRMHLRDLSLAPGATVAVTVKAVDAAGNLGPAAEAQVRVADHQATTLPGKDPTWSKDVAALPKLGGVSVAVIDELDKVQPVTGTMVPPQPAEYLAANHLWNAKAGTIQLHAARNEFVAFQVLLRGVGRGIKPSLEFERKRGAAVAANFCRYFHVGSAQGPLPDPIVPLDVSGIDVPSADLGTKGMRSSSLHCEIWVPHGAASGEHKGKLTLRAGRNTLAFDVLLHVWDFTLPDHLSFLPEMNAYGLPANERDYYRLAHLHRTVLNKVPYYHDGSVQAGCAPGWNGRTLDWGNFDRRFGPLFTGELFDDLPRRGVPLECFYLPLFDNWPSPMAGNYNGDYWADRAFTAGYRRDFVEVSRQIAEHARDSNWRQTLFQCYFNGKTDWKKRGWSRGTCPWLLDEPANFQDFWALRWFGAAFQEGVLQARAGARMVFRADISRPEWQRDSLDGVLDYNVVGSAIRPYNRMVLDRKRANREILLEYGTANAVEDPNVQPLAWCLDAWCLGADGVVPWQTVGSATSWREADQTALFYPGGTPTSGVAPSVRLKAFRRGQQDIEYLTLLTRLLKEPRWAVGQSVRAALPLTAEGKATQHGGADDAGVMHYERFKPKDAWALRVRLGEVLSRAGLTPANRLVDFRAPEREPARLTSMYVAGDRATLPTKVKASPQVLVEPLELQGRSAVVDALINPAEPFSKLGKIPRGNAISKKKEQCVFLVRFNLDALKLPKNAKVQQATVSFYVWDPSSQGKTKVAAHGLKTAWTEADVSWKQPADGARWKGDGHFSLEKDAGPAVGYVVVLPDVDTDTVDPPLEYEVDVSALVKSWLAGELPNNGLALVPVPDPSVDEGLWTRFQIYASEYHDAQYGPKLTVTLAK